MSATWVSVTTPRRTLISLDAVATADGTSNTLMFGESLNSSYGTPRDVGHACAFLASEAAAYITGTSIVIDGGQIIVEEKV